MKDYLFGLGAMIVGAGLMFVLMHGEVEAETSDKVLELYCERGDVGFILVQCNTVRSKI